MEKSLCESVWTCENPENICTVCLIASIEVKRGDLLLCAVDELIFVGPFPAGPHTLVLPEDLCMVIILLERERGVWINNVPHLEITASQAPVLGPRSPEIKMRYHKKGAAGNMYLWAKQESNQSKHDILKSLILIIYLFFVCLFTGFFREEKLL